MPSAEIDTLGGAAARLLSAVAGMGVVDPHVVELPEMEATRVCTLVPLDPIPDCQMASAVLPSLETVT